MEDPGSNGCSMAPAARTHLLTAVPGPRPAASCGCTSAVSDWLCAGAGACMCLAAEPLSLCLRAADASWLGPKALPWLPRLRWGDSCMLVPLRRAAQEGVRMGDWLLGAGSGAAAADGASCCSQELMSACGQLPSCTAGSGQLRLPGQLPRARRATAAAACSQQPTSTPCCLSMAGAISPGELQPSKPWPLT